jgi:hypothetical protein
MHFGLYLQSKRVISADQLVAALKLQIKHLAPIGQLALEAGILSAREVFDVLRAQHDAPYERFGELAIALGFMNHDDLMRLLLMQSDRKPLLSDILVRLGTLTAEQARQELDAFRRTRTGSSYRIATTIVPTPHRRLTERTAIDATLAI